MERESYQNCGYIINRLQVQVGKYRYKYRYRPYRYRYIRSGDEAVGVDFACLLLGAATDCSARPAKYKHRYRHRAREPQYASRWYRYR